MNDNVVLLPPFACLVVRVTLDCCQQHARQRAWKATDYGGRRLGIMLSEREAVAAVVGDLVEVFRVDFRRIPYEERP